MSTTNMVGGSLPSPLTAPPNFPVTWPRPEDERLFWMHDRLHVPKPITQLDGWSLYQIYEHGISAAAQAYEVPLRCRARRINTYFYFALIPVDVPPEEVGARSKRVQETLSTAMARMGETWRTAYLPEIQAHLAYWTEFDLAGATMPALLTHLDETVVRHRRLYELHMLIWIPFMTAMSLFDELYGDLFEQDSALDAYRLLQGRGSKTLERDRALWRLGRTARAATPVRQVLEERAAADVPATLAASAPGRAFLAELQAYLSEYGAGVDKWELSYPSPLEDPTPVIKMLKDYITQPDRDLEAEQVALDTERERLVAEARARLAAYPQQVVDQFEFLLEAAQEAVVLSEDHSFWIDFRGLYEVRRVFLEFGRRFRDAGVVDAPEDVFYLTPDDIRETAMALPRLDRRRVVAGQRAEMAYFRTITPPAALGTVPPGPAPDDPLSRALGKFFGDAAPSPTEPNILRGTAGSPGIVRGPARVLRSLADADKLRTGDVLVAETTAPPWTHLFATAAAVVTDTGGMLSHCAVVAREYGIPAVVGVGRATDLIHDGQIVEVDGHGGVVRLSPRS